MAAPTTPSRTAAAVTAALALLQAWWAWRDRSGTGVPAAAVLAPMSLLAAIALARANCLETRLPVVLVVFAQLGLTSLAVTIGLPGQHPHGLDLRSWTQLVVPFLVLVLIELDRQARAARRGRSPEAEVPPPYAR